MSARVLTKHAGPPKAREHDHLWLLTGAEGVVQFRFGLSLFESGQMDADGDHWVAWDLGYHSPTQRFAGQQPIAQECADVPWEGPCYYDGTSLGAKEVLAEWLAIGCDDAVIRAHMERRYDEWLCSTGDAFASPVTALFYGGPK